MSVAAGLSLGLVLGSLYLWAIRRSPETERRSLTAGLLIVALIYVGFAFVGGAPDAWRLIELGGVLLYGIFAGLGLRKDGRWLAVGWAGHALWDVPLHLHGPAATYVPDWYLPFCLSFDLLVAAYAAWRFWPTPPPHEPNGTR